MKFLFFSFLWDNFFPAIEKIKRNLYFVRHAAFGPQDPDPQLSKNASRIRL
jgi:hypothetical protein